MIGVEIDLHIGSRAEYLRQVNRLESGRGLSKTSSGSFRPETVSRHQAAGGTLGEHRGAEPRQDSPGVGAACP